MATKPNAQAIRDYVAERAAALELNPGVAIGLIEELSSYNTGRTGNRLGLMGAPVDSVRNPDEFTSDWRAQIDMGLMSLAAAKQQAGGTDLGAAISYLGGNPAAPDPKLAQRALRAYTRGTKYTGEPIDEATLSSAYSAFGVSGNPAKDLKAAGIKVAAPAAAASQAQMDPSAEPVAAAGGRITREQIAQLAGQYAPGLESAIDAIAGIESTHGENLAAYRANSVGAIGPMQILSKKLGAKYGNFEQYAAPGMTDPNNPVHATVAGIRMYADLARKNGGNLDAATNEYFTGSPNPAPGRTDGLTTAAGYLQKFRTAMGSPKAPAGSGLVSAEPAAPQAQPSADQAPIPDDFADQVMAQLSDEQADEQRADSVDERVRAAFDDNTTDLIGGGVDRFIELISKET